MLRQEITDASAWIGSDLKQDTKWTQVLPDYAISQLLDAADRLQKTGLIFPDFSQSDFIIPAMKKGPGRVC